MLENLVGFSREASIQVCDITSFSFVLGKQNNCTKVSSQYLNITCGIYCVLAQCVCMYVCECVCGG